MNISTNMIGMQSVGFYTLKQLSDALKKLHNKTQNA